MKNRTFSNRHPVLYRTLVALGSTAVPFIVGFAPIFLLLAYADRISGVLFAVLLVLYIALLFAVAILVVRPRRMNELRAILGDEAFFARYPHEKKKELRRWKKVDAYRDTGAAEEPAPQKTIAERVQAEEAWRRRRNRTVLIIVCTIILFAATMILLYDNRDAISDWTGYVRAELAESAGKPQEAIDRFSVLGDYKDAAARAAKLAQELVQDDAYFKPFREAEVGDVVTFGTYEQDNREDNGKEPIRWIVIAKEGGRELLLSESVLDAQPWRTETGERNGWKGSWIRNWLNDTFYETAFSETERYLIGKTGLEYSYYRSTGSSHSKRVTASTEDRVFLLDSEEKITYLLDDESGQRKDCYYAEPTAYALAHGAIPFEDNPYAPEGACGWWDRSGNGSSDYGVRPAIWILAGE